MITGTGALPRQEDQRAKSCPSSCQDGFYRIATAGGERGGVRLMQRRPQAVGGCQAAQERCQAAQRRNEPSYTAAIDSSTSATCTIPLPMLSGPRNCPKPALNKVGLTVLKLPIPREQVVTNPGCGSRATLPTTRGLAHFIRTLNDKEAHVPPQTRLAGRKISVPTPTTTTSSSSHGFHDQDRTWRCED